MGALPGEIVIWKGRVESLFESFHNFLDPLFSFPRHGNFEKHCARPLTVPHWPLNPNNCISAIREPMRKPGKPQELLLQQSLTPGPCNQRLLEGFI